MDINRLFKAGMRACGTVLNILPKEDIGSPMDYMMEILRDETIPSLNIIFPRLFPVTFFVGQLIPINGSDASVDMERFGLDVRYVPYRVPKSLTEGLKIMSVKSCIPTSSVDSGAHATDSIFGCTNSLYTWSSARNFGRYSSANMYEASAYAALNYADRQLAGQYTSAFRYKFFPPNILFILTSYAKDSLSLTATFCLENDENLVSIEDTAYEGVRRLFILDLKKSIYDQYKLFSNVQTQNGDLDAKIDDWSSAESERNELYDNYRATSHFRTSSMRTG